MDILEEKQPINYNDSIKQIIKLLTFQKNKLYLKGSSSYSSQQYFADYDLFCSLCPNKDEFYDFLLELLDKIQQSTDLYFIELKFQTKDNKKIRIYRKTKLDKKIYNSIFDNLDFVKIDLVARIDNIFTEISCIYLLNKDILTKKDIEKNINDEASELYKEGEYYKVLKRKFSLAKINNNKTELLALSKIFNSELGKEYKLISNLQAMDLVLDNYQDKDVIDKIIINLKDLNLPTNIKSITKFIKDRKDKLNKEAKLFL
jgi:hypothetical protein